MNTLVPVLPESKFERAMSIFNRLVKKPEYRKDRVKAIIEAAKKVDTTFRILQEEMSRHHSKNAFEKKVLLEIAKEDEEKRKFDEMWQENEVRSGHAMRDEFGEFIHLDPEYMRGA